MRPRLPALWSNETRAVTLPRVSDQSRRLTRRSLWTSGDSNMLVRRAFPSRAATPARIAAGVSRRLKQLPRDSSGPLGPRRNRFDYTDRGGRQRRARDVFCALLSWSVPGVKRLVEGTSPPSSPGNTAAPGNCLGLSAYSERVVQHPREHRSREGRTDSFIGRRLRVMREAAISQLRRVVTPLISA